MKRHRYHTERRSKKLSPDRREALDEQCKWSNQQPMSSIYDLKDRKSTDWSHAVRLLDDPSPEVYLTGPAKKLEALMHRLVVSVGAGTIVPQAPRDCTQARAKHRAHSGRHNRDICGQGEAQPKRARAQKEEGEP